MALTITDEIVTSDLTDVHAEFRPHAAANGEGAWVVYGSPWAARLFDRHQALTAMIVADERAKPEPNQALINALESELR